MTAHRSHAVLLLALAVLACGSSPDAIDARTDAGPDASAADAGPDSVTPPAPRHRRADFPDPLEMRCVPAYQIDLGLCSTTAFSDLGAWHGFLAGDPADPSTLGGFGGPLLHPASRWIAPELAQLRLQDASGADLPLTLRDDDRVSLLPGMLLQRAHAGDVAVEAALIFADDRTALVRFRLTAPARTTLRVAWHGAVFPEIAGLETRADGGVTASHRGISVGTAHVVFPEGLGLTAVIGDDQRTWSADLPGPLTLEPDAPWQAVLALPYYVDDAERAAREPGLPALLARADDAFTANEARWDRYVSAALPEGNRWADDARYRPVAVKALVTLMDNWRSAALDQKHAGLWPSSTTPVGFHAFWAWDSWKHAVALAAFEPALAEDQVRAMYDYQSDEGMVPDTVTLHQQDQYWGCTKPPLSAWAVTEILRRTGDVAFVSEMLPRLVKYHRWWTARRDHDGNGLCEFGSTDGAHQNGGNESGMDNAARFDDAVMQPNGPGAWSFDQESVDLNAYLWAEKLYLAELDDAVGDAEGAAAFRQEAEALRSVVSTTMYDASTGWFYDVRTPGQAVVPIQGPEGWTPLWTGLATQTQADRVVQGLLDPAKFATYIPFPTLAADDPRFDPDNGYWRGMIWLDQVWFGIEALRRYGYDAEADEMTTRLLERPEGILGTGPFRENYDPRDGRGARDRHFSWTAAHYLMLFTGTATGGNTPSDAR
jgi:putative isomerase